MISTSVLKPQNIEVKILVNCGLPVLILVMLMTKSNIK